MNTNIYGSKITRLIEEFSKLPGIGHKTAQRLAFYLLSQPASRAESLADAIVGARHGAMYCSICCNITDVDPCAICSSARRDKSLIMVVETPKDLAAYENTNNYSGLYHVLHGAINPIAGIRPEHIKAAELVRRLGNMKDEVKEVILATNTTVEGEATAVYISKLLAPLGVTVSRIAHGIPVGGDLEYVDAVTLIRALEGRRGM
ncbi:MAG: recombination mediator RecR [Clostridiales bacterium]|jgi:recombination protein RecR|nr:recombination mediator RecR [Clostridiales bacterium]MDR2749594.1 recombination mediator RecR [Clostridiales bacterium]